MKRRDGEERRDGEVESGAGGEGLTGSHGHQPLPMQTTA